MHLRGCFLFIGSPSSKNDELMRLFRLGQSGDSSIYSLQLPTWEFNKYVPRDDPDVLEYYAEDPIGAERDIGANPPFANKPYLYDLFWIRKFIYQKR